MLTRHGALSESDVSTAMRDVRMALLEADVALGVVKIVNDHLVKMLGGAGSVAAGASNLKLANRNVINYCSIDLTTDRRHLTTGR